MVGLSAEVAGAVQGKSAKLKLAKKVGSPLSVFLHLDPWGDPPKFADEFRRRMEQWDEFWEGAFQPVPTKRGGEFHFDLREVQQRLSKGGYTGARPWLLHSTAGVSTADGSHWFVTTGLITSLHSWDIIDRAVERRCFSHWQAEWGSYWENTSIGNEQTRHDAYMKWRSLMLQRLDHVMVRFEAELVR